MGGNTYSRKNFSNEELSVLLNKVIETPLVSVGSSKMFITNKSWRADVSRYLDTDSCLRFYFMIATHNKTHHCAHCSVMLEIASFNGKTIREGFTKYCPACTKIEIWKSTHSIESLKSRGHKITKSKLEFYQTEAGQITAKETGRKNKISLTEFNKTKQGLINQQKSKLVNSTIMKAKILSGEFTPNSNNRNTHWDAEYNGKKYRSSWEAIYQSHYPDDLHEQLRIPYQFNGKEYIYIVDFVNYDTGIATEVKPRELCNDLKFIAKVNALKIWCSAHCFTFQLVDLAYLQLLAIPKNLQDFDQNTQTKILKIYAKTIN
jgi:hypothetical protein